MISRMGAMSGHLKKDRNATTIERDLLKAAMQEQDVGRSIPGKVKLSIPQLSTKLKK